MPRTCPTYAHSQCFANIEGDELSSEELKDGVNLVLATATNETEARAIYENWREATLGDRKFTEHPKTFEINERVGRLRYRPIYISQLAEQLRSDTGLGIDEADIEDLVSWMLGEPSTMEETSARFLFDTFLAAQRIEAHRAGIFERPREILNLWTRHQRVCRGSLVYGL